MSRERSKDGRFPLPFTLPDVFSSSTTSCTYEECFYSGNHLIRSRHAKLRSLESDVLSNEPSLP